MSHMSRIHNFDYFVSTKNDFNVSSTTVLVSAKYVSDSHMMLIRDQTVEIEALDTGRCIDTNEADVVSFIVSFMGHKFLSLVQYTTLLISVNIKKIKL